MKGKFIFSALCLVAAGIVTYASYKTLEGKTAVADLMLDENVEALTDGEGYGNYNICYSESKVAKGHTYYDCGNCLIKVYDEKGKGSYSKCFY
ncbi:MULTISPECIES: hypothetical protein [Bacteroidales]|uniref:hypothetical protein n=1 Tax=Bacteroides pyogenes TaxID=310300 RepID=UPI002F930AFA